jgi:transcriptional regulator GlxA family with amidase domain
MTPVQYQHQIRVEEARSLLLNSNLSIAEVGWQVGFQNPSVFSRCFRTLAGVTPRQYRIAVRGKTFAINPTAVSRT